MNKVLVLMMLPLLLLAAEWQSLNGPPAGRADDMSVGLYEGEWVIYAADNTHRLYISTNEGEYWDSIVTNANVVRPTCVITEPNDAQVVYIGEYPYSPNTHCVWKSTNGGETWNYKDDGISNSNPLCFAMDPDYPDTVFLGCEQDDTYPEMFMTTDGGTNWSALNGCPDDTVNEIGIRPSDPRGQELVIATNNGIYYTSNGGANWSLKLAKSYMSSVSYANQFVVYAGRNHPNEGLFKSTDGGSSWGSTAIGDFSYVRAVATVGPNEIYVAANTSTEGRGIYRTTNGGTNWTYYGREHGLFCNDSILEILIDPDYSSNHRIYVAGEWAIYQFDLSSGDWQELSRGFPVDTMPQFDIKDNYIYVAGTHRSPPAEQFGNPVLTIWRSTNAGQSWLCIEGAPYKPDEIPVQYVYNEIHPNPIMPVLPKSCITISPRDRSTFFFSGLTPIYSSEDERAHSIFKSFDCGLSWQESYGGGEPCRRKAYAISIAPLEPDTIFAGYAKAMSTDIRILRSLDEGSSMATWEARTIGLDDDSDIYAIAIDPINSSTVYAASRYYGVYRSYNMGDRWYPRMSYGNQAMTLAVDPDITSIAFAGMTDGVEKTENKWDTYAYVNNGLTYTYITDLEIDPEEPTIVYLLGQTDGQSATNHCYLTVDRAGKWFEITDGLPDYTYDLEIDPDNPEKTYSSTETGLYYYTPDFNKSLVSSSDIATSYNNGQHMMRIEGTNELWVAYESGGVIYVTRTTNGGASWSKKMELGKGSYPVISYDPLAETPIPGVVWYSLDSENQHNIYFARHVTGNQWTDPTLIVTSSSAIDPPSFVIADGNWGHLAYTEGSTVKYRKFNIFNPVPTTPEWVGTGHNPSIGYMTSATNPDIHITWQYDDQIWYRHDPFGMGLPDRVSQQSTTCFHPSLAIQGNVVYFVWEASGDISWRSYTCNHPFYTWGVIKPVCYTISAPSTYPLLAGGHFCSWVEENMNNYEVYCSSYNPEVGGWTSPLNISNGTAETFSNFPHIVHYQTLLGTIVYFIWTEGSENIPQPTAPPYEVKFKPHSFGGPGEGSEDVLPMYIVQCGEQEPSPFTIHRQGYAHFGTEPYKRVDYDSLYLKYRFTHLDPDRIYLIQGYFYQRGSSNLPITVDIDGHQLAILHIPPDTLIIGEHIVPDLLYQDGQIALKIFGNNAVSAILVLSEFEPDNKGGGPQGTEGLSGMPDCFSLHAYPCPASNVFFMEYAVPTAGVVHVTLYDVAGRSVQEIRNTYCEPGIYQKRVDLKGITQGVYFLRLESNKEVVTKKVIMLQ